MIGIGIVFVDNLYIDYIYTYVYIYISPFIYVFFNFPQKYFVVFSLRALCIFGQVNP